MFESGSFTVARQCSTRAGYITSSEAVNVSGRPHAASTQPKQHAAVADETHCKWLICSSESGPHAPLKANSSSSSLLEHQRHLPLPPTPFRSLSPLAPDLCSPNSIKSRLNQSVSARAAAEGEGEASSESGVADV